MKKIILALFVALFSSCTTSIKAIKDYSERMMVLERDFPEIYHLFKNGDVIIDNVYYVTKKDGSVTSNVSYHYRTMVGK